MKYIFFIISFLISFSALGSVTFKGLLEDSSIDKNSFLCPSGSAGEGDETCQNRDDQARGFKFDGPKILQIFNNQQYWVQQQYKERGLLMARAYGSDSDSDSSSDSSSDSDSSQKKKAVAGKDKKDKNDKKTQSSNNNDDLALDAEMQKRGWKTTGAFLLVITTDSLITDQIDPDKIPAKGKIKVAAQLWYNGQDSVQLWAQDALLIDEGAAFSVSLSNSDSSLYQEQKGINQVGYNLYKGDGPKSFLEIKKQFLQEIELVPKNINQNEYISAYGSPRSVTIIPA